MSRAVPELITHARRCPDLSDMSIILRNFDREISGMRRVRHQHCVNLIASCTDIDSVTILSSRVADMDLSALLDSNLDHRSAKILKCAIGCVTSALTYLHSLGIRCVDVTCEPRRLLTYARHDDLKPSNILIHGTNVLLTDFGFWYASLGPRAINLLTNGALVLTPPIVASRLPWDPLPILRDVTLPPKCLHTSPEVV